MFLSTLKNNVCLNRRQNKLKLRTYLCGRQTDVIGGEGAGHFWLEDVDPHLEHALGVRLGRHIEGAPLDGLRLPADLSEEKRCDCT